MPNFNRSTNLTDLDSHLAVANIIERGKTSDWEALFRRASESSKVRASIRLACKTLPPDTTEWAIKIWRTLLRNMQSAKPKKGNR